MRVSKLPRNPWSMLVITGTTGLLVPALALATLSSKPEGLAGHPQARLELAGQATLIEPPLLMTHGGDVLDTTTLETSALTCERVAGVLERVGVLAAKTGREDLEEDTERLRKRIQRLHGRLEEAAHESRMFLHLQGRHRFAMAFLIRALRQHALGSLYGEFLALRQAAGELDSGSDEEDRKRVDGMRQRFRSHVQTSPLDKDRRDSILAALDAHRRASFHRDQSARTHRLEGYGNALHTLEQQMQTLIHSEHVEGLGTRLLDLVKATGRFEQFGDHETLDELERVERQVQDCVAASLLPEARRVKIERLENRVRKARTGLTRARSRLRLTQEELEFLLATVRDESDELRTSVRSHVHAGELEDANTLPTERLRSAVLRGLLWALLAVNATVGAWVGIQFRSRKRGPHDGLPAGYEEPLEPDPAHVALIDNDDEFVVLEEA